MSEKPCVLLMGPCNSLLQHLLTVRGLLESHDITVLLVDFGKANTKHAQIDIESSDVRFQHFKFKDDISAISMEEYNNTMADCCASLLRDLQKQNRIHGVLAVADCGALKIASPALHFGLPTDYPKVIVADVQPPSRHVWESNIIVIPTIVTISSPNFLLRTIFKNAAACILAIATLYMRSRATPAKEKVDLSPSKKRNRDGFLKIKSMDEASGEEKKKRVAITKLPCTSIAADSARNHFEGLGYEVLSFSANELGGYAMEQLIIDGQIDAVLDLTTRELRAKTMGHSTASTERLKAAAMNGIPQVVSVGGLDMIKVSSQKALNKYLGRKYHKTEYGNALVRKSPEECKSVGEIIAQRMVENCRFPDRVQVMVPTGGLSNFSKVGGPLEDLEADTELLEALEVGLKGSRISIRKSSFSLNTENFGLEAAKLLVDLISL